MRGPTTPPTGQGSHTDMLVNAISSIMRTSAPRAAQPYAAMAPAPALDQDPWAVPAVQAAPIVSFEPITYGVDDVAAGNDAGFDPNRSALATRIPEARPMAASLAPVVPLNRPALARPNAAIDTRFDASPAQTADTQLRAAVQQASIGPRASAAPGTGPATPLQLARTLSAYSAMRPS